MNKIFLFLACLVSALSQAQVYDFPIKPGTEEWGKLVIEADRFAAMQIPEDQLKSMDSPYNSLTLRSSGYSEVNYNTVPNKPFTETFEISGYGTFSASVSNDARYNVDLYEWKADYPSDWYIYPLNSIKSSVSIQRSSTPRSCYVYARAHNSYGWGEWQSIGWVYASSSYSLFVAQNLVNSTLNVQIEPTSEMTEAIGGKTTYSSTNQTYSVGLYSSNTGICVYQSTVNNKDNNRLELNIDVSGLPNGIYILHVKNTQVNESPQTLKIIVKH